MKSFSLPYVGILQFMLDLIKAKDDFRFDLFNNTFSNYDSVTLLGKFGNYRMGMCTGGK